MRSRPPVSRTAEGARARRFVNVVRCTSDRSACPNRAACEMDAELLARARAGSRADFDALYDRYFAVFYRAARERLASRALAEAYTRDLLESVFCAPSHPPGCASAHLLRLVKRIGTRGARGSPERTRRA